MSKKILIVDDSLFMRNVLKDNLPDKYKVVEAASGSKAKEQFRKEKPDLTLLDIIMPEGEEEGISVLKNIKKINPKANVVMVTA
ncbi:MAG: CheY-like receiver, partial [Candidatus Scalindua rubra]